MVWTLVPWLNWIAWLHVAIRTRRPVYLLAMVVYAVPFMLALGSGETRMVDWLAGAAAASWFLSIAHALLVRRRVADRIRSADSNTRIVPYAIATVVVVVAAGAFLPSLAPSLAERLRRQTGDPLSEPVASMSEPRMAMAAAAWRDEIYVMGGVNRRGEFLNAVELYRPDHNEWWPRDGLLANRGMAAAVAHGNRIIVLGGRNSAGVLDSVEALDLGRSQWTSLPPLPSPRWGHSAVVAGDRLYVVGGIEGTGQSRRAINAVDVFDLAANTWSRGSVLATPRHSAALAVVDGKLYVLGGREGAGNSGEATASVQVLDLATGVFGEGRLLLKARTGAQAAAVGTRIYVIGGAAEGTATESVEIYDTATDSSTEIRMSGARTGHAVALLPDGRILVIGGASEESPRAILKTVDVLNVR